MSSAAITSAAVAVLLLTSCGAEEHCTTAVVPGDCHDLTFKGISYDEWREAVLPNPFQELGDATYPACNDTDSCDGEGLGGFGATDVWLLEGVDPSDAVLGLREGTHTAVIFVAVGVDPASLEGRIDPGVLSGPATTRP